MWPGRSLLEYCLERDERSFSPLPVPPLAGSKVGRAAVVIATEGEGLFLMWCGGGGGYMPG